MSGCWKHHLMIKNLCWELLDDDVVGTASHLGQQPSRRSPAAAKITASTLPLACPLDPGLDVPPNRHDLQPKIPAGGPVEHLHGAPRSSGTDPVAVAQIIKSPPDQHVAGVLTRGNRDDLQILCRSRSAGP